jgi:methyl-accepting chemotaxis protein
VSHNAVAVSENASALLKNIIPDIEHTTTLIREVAAASNQQTAGIEQINASMQNLNNVTQNNAASAEEMASTSANLAVQSEELKQAVAFFKTDTTTGGRNVNNKSRVTISSKPEQRTAPKPEAQPRSNDFMMPDNKPVKKTAPRRKNAIEKKTGGTFIDMSKKDDTDSNFESF